MQAIALRFLSPRNQSRKGQQNPDADINQPSTPILILDSLLQGISSSGECSVFHICDTAIKQEQKGNLLVDFEGIADGESKVESTRSFLPAAVAPRMYDTDTDAMFAYDLGPVARFGSSSSEISLSAPY